MSGSNLFQLGIGLETGAQAEDTRISDGAIGGQETAERDLFDESRDDHFIRREGKVFAGTHLIIEVVNGHGLDDEARIQQAFRDSVEICGATLLHIHTHKFSPQGVSGVAVLAESHISVHTWPEIGYGAFDVFMCGDAEPWRAVDVLKKAFHTDDVRVKELLRGDGLVTDTVAA
ncbi:adenosylmethionine decarboxylase [Profundibacterium mesophilum]|uniref:S-adenosylmethionine decarboxylase proenzyme n=1 Tax=Profundibacterium mesophilum KAUST100406-0324 TaxID=1037889 RepID=A0A921NXA8_9RHOB|nr:adenosylmethionine decarboxylase [Profundibacterium mesophilum]KAF0675233.1 S-adenosylmethionine decarboxylase proenzyme [Profundibacterium mesophilum KAUST100406-0324]